MWGCYRGALFVETLLGIPGIGSFIFESVTSRDYNVILAIVLILTTAFVLANLLVDVALIIIDPRIRAVGREPPMTIAAAPLEAPQTAERDLRSESLWMRAARRLLRKKIAVVCLVFIFLFYFVALFAPWIAPYGYADQNLDSAFEGPSMDHWLGTDRTGRDVLSRTIFASRTTAIVTIATVSTASILLPLTLGMLAGYRGGWVDSVIMRGGEILASLPGLPMLVLINATLRPRFVELGGGCRRGVIGWQGFTESGGADYFLICLRAVAFRLGGRRAAHPHADAGAARDASTCSRPKRQGASTPRILFRHLLAQRDAAHHRRAVGVAGRDRRWPRSG